MKTIKFLTVIALCSAIIYGCSTKSSAPPQLVAVPENATMVLSLNAKQIIEKAELNKPEQYKSYSLLKNEFENESAKTAEVLNNFLKDTRTSGLNLDRIFAYLVVDENTAKGHDPGFGIVFLVDDVNALETFLKNCGLNPDDIANKSVVFFSDEKLQWNDKIAVISRNVANYDIDIFNEDDSKSVLAKESFNSEYSERDDAYLFFEYNVISKLLANYPRYAYTPTPNMSAFFNLYKDLSLSVKFNAEKGEFVTTGKLLPAERGKELFGKFYKTSFDDELYNYFPDKSLMAFKLAIKPLDIYNELKEYLTDITGNDKQREKFLKDVDPKITSILGNFTGDLLGSLTEINMSSTPDFAVAAGIVEGKENEIIALMKEAGFVKKPEGYYTVGSVYAPLYFAVNNKAAYLTGNKTYITNFLDNMHHTSNITSAAAFGKELKNAPSYFYLDININHYPAILKSLIGMSSTGSMVAPVLEKLEAMTMQIINPNVSEFKIKFTDNEYASKILLKELDKLASQYLSE